VLRLCREQHISAFTRIIYFQGIAMSVAFGDCAPLVGHNAFLRWSSVKKVRPLSQDTLHSDQLLLLTCWSSAITVDGSRPPAQYCQYDDCQWQ
jgi:hypothetical protein